MGCEGEFVSELDMSGFWCGVYIVWIGESGGGTWVESLMGLCDMCTVSGYSGEESGCSTSGGRVLKW